MYRKSLKKTVKWFSYTFRSGLKECLRAFTQLLSTYREFNRPDECELCGDTVYVRRLPRSSTHPGRGKWVCEDCIYHPPGIATPMGPPVPDMTVQQAIDNAIGFRGDLRQIHCPDGGYVSRNNGDLMGIYAKASEQHDHAAKKDDQV